MRTIRPFALWLALIAGCKAETPPREPVDPATRAYCSALSRYRLEGECYRMLAEESGDPDLCHETTGHARAACLAAVAARTGKIELCRAVAHERSKNECYYDAAAAGGRREACADLAERARKICEAIASGEPDACRPFEGGEAFACVTRVAARDGDLEACTSLRTGPGRWAIWRCQRDVALKARRLEMCDVLPHDNSAKHHSARVMWRDCRSTIERFQRTEMWCEPDDRLCVSKTSGQAGDPAKCKNATLGVVEELCLLSIAYRNRNVVACESLEPPELRTQCAKAAARRP